MRNLGRYEIIEQIGAGSMGAVYKARDPLMGRDVAIKTILAQAIEGPNAEEFRERFFREAKAAGRLVHPSIVTVHDVSESEGTPFLVMEYVSGRTLQSILQQGERLDLQQVREIAIQLAEALHYAHQNGVIHRDIKPANILVTSGNRVKIADFGVAKLMGSQVTNTGQLLGTPAFMSPEQFSGVPVDGRVDIFAVGVVLYWMATGDKPFTGDTVLSVQYKIVHTDPVPPRKLNPAIPANLEAAILKSLQKDPAERYQSGEELARDLRAVRDSVSIAPRAAAAASSDAPTIPPASSPQKRRPLDKTVPTLVVREKKGMSRALFAALVTVVFTSLIVVGLMKALRQKPTAPPSPQAAAVESPPTPPPSGTPTEKQTTVPAQKNSVAPSIEKTEPIAETPGEAPAPAAESQPATLPPPPTQLDTAPAPDNEFVARGNRNALGSVLRQRQLAQAADSARLLITSPKIAEFMTIVVRVDNRVLFRRDATAPVPASLEEGRRRGQFIGISTIPLAEERLIPPGEHMLQVNILLGARRLGESEEVIGQFNPGQRRTLDIEFVPEPQRLGKNVRRFNVSLN